MCQPSLYFFSPSVMNILSSRYAKCRFSSHMLVLCLIALVVDTAQSEGVQNETEKVSQFVRRSLEQVKLGEKQLKIGCLPGHVMVGMIFSVHKNLDVYDEYSTLKCGKDIDVASMMVIQYISEFLDDGQKLAMHFDIMNYNFLNNIKVGAYILDDCSSETVCMYQLQKLYDMIYLHPNVTVQDSCSLNRNQSAPIVGIVEVSSKSRNSPQVHNLMNILKFPYLNLSGIAWTSATIKYQTEHLSVHTFTDEFILFDILMHFGWTYISLIYTYDFYHLNEVEALAKYHGVCIASSRSVTECSDQENYEDIIKDLSKEPNANVVVSFCRSTVIMDGLVKAMKSLNVTDRLLLISSYDWFPYDLKWMKQHSSPRALTYCRTTNDTQIKYKQDKGSRGLMKTNNEAMKRNPWLTDFWEQQKSINSSNSICLGKAYMHHLLVATNAEMPCGMNMVQLLAGYKPITIVRATEADYISSLFYPYIKEEQKENDYSYVGRSGFRESFVDELLNLELPRRVEYFDYLKTHTTDELASKKYEVYFEIYYNEVKDNYSLIAEGHWRSNEKRTVITINDSTVNINIRSVCSAPCGFGHRKVVPSQRPACCWECEPCPRSQILVNNTCQSCDNKQYWPNENKTDCQQIETKPIQWTDFEFLISLEYTILVISLTTVSFYYFVKNRNTPVVKSSTRELSYMMLISVFTTECIIFFIMLDSTPATCALIRATLLLSFTTMYAALLVKTVRLARLLALSKNEFPRMSMKFMSTESQVAITCVLIILQVILLMFVSSMYSAEPDTIIYNDDDDDVEPPYAKLVCSIDDKVVRYNFSFVFLLVLLCTGCAVWTRNVPDNFNEAKYIGFCMYTTCLTWTGFGLTYFNTEYKILTLCACSSTNALTTLIFLFFPKLYIIIFKPEKNDKKYFTTAKGIRFHKGKPEKREMKQVNS